MSPHPTPLRNHKFRMEPNKIAPEQVLLQGGQKSRDPIRTTFVPITELPVRKDYKEKTPQGSFTSNYNTKTEKRVDPKTIQQNRSSKYDSIDLEHPVVPPFN